jgi:hypothetical protein
MKPNNSRLLHSPRTTHYFGKSQSIIAPCFFPYRLLFASQVKPSTSKMPIDSNMDPHDKSTPASTTAGNTTPATDLPSSLVEMMRSGLQVHDPACQSHTPLSTSFHPPGHFASAYYKARGEHLMQILKEVQDMLEEDDLFLY